MARIAGVDLPRDKRIEIGLTYVFGIGNTSAKRILEMTGINPDTRVRDLTDEEEARIRECIDKEFIVEGDLRRQVALNIKNLTEIGSYQTGDHRFAYDEVVYRHKETGELWVMVTMLGMGGGRTFYERYDDMQEIQEVLRRCK